MAISEQILLSIFTYIPFLVVSCCFWLHFKNHFGLNCNHPGLIRVASQTSPRGTNGSKHGNICCCSINNRIEFYPISTLFYFGFLLVSILFISIFYYDHYQQHHDVEYCAIKSNIFLLINNPFPSISLPIHIDTNISSYIVLFVLLWETLFNFYRFFDANYVATYLRNASKITIFALFSIYSLIFSALYLVQINFYFGLLPILVLIHFIFNVYCAAGFVSILKRQQRHLLEGESKHLQNGSVMKELVSIIHRVRRCSLITTFISTSFLFIVTACSTSYTIILLPVFWMISSILWLLNFSKNKSWINKRCKNLKRTYKRCCLCSNKQSKAGKISSVAAVTPVSVSIQIQNNTAYTAAVKKLKQNTTAHIKANHHHRTQNTAYTDIRLDVEEIANSTVPRFETDAVPSFENDAGDSDQLQCPQDSSSAPEPIVDDGDENAVAEPLAQPKSIRDFKHRSTVELLSVMSKEQLFSATRFKHKASPSSWDGHIRFDLNGNIILSKDKISNEGTPTSPNGNELVMKKDYDYGHKKSLSTMSGFAMRRKHYEAIAASSILDMMVNQGFYSKGKLNSAQMINLAL